MPERTVAGSMSQRHADAGVADAVPVMIERGFRHLPIVADGRFLGVFSVRDALPREVSTAVSIAVSIADFNEQVNDALG